MRNGLLSERGIAKEEQRECQDTESESHGNLAESGELLTEIIRLTKGFTTKDTKVHEGKLEAQLL